MTTEGSDGSWYNIPIAVYENKVWVRQSDGKDYIIDNEDDWMFFSDFLDDQISALQEKIRLLRAEKRACKP